MSSATDRTAPELILIAERVHTFSSTTVEDPASVNAIAIRDGRILEVGNDTHLRELADEHTVIDDMPGATVTPGLTDGHTHIVFGLELTRGVQLADLSLHEVRDQLAAAARQVESGTWLFGWGVDPNIFTETGFDGRIFDDVTNDRPIFLRMRDAHSAIVNTAAITAVGLTGNETFPDESAVVVDETGAPTGYLLELAAMDLVYSQAPTESMQERVERLGEVLNGMAQAGLTGTHVMDFHPGSQEVLERYEAQAELPLRLRFSPMVPPGSSQEQLDEIAAQQGLHGRRWRVEGVKFMIDGTIDNGSAWLTEPDCYGESLHSIWTDPQAYRDALRFFAEKGISTATHAIGDQGVSFVLDAIEALGDIASRASHRIEHIETIPDQTVARFAQLGVAASMQPIHGTRHTRADRSDNWSQRLGEVRAARGWRSADLRRSGAVLALGSDWPVTPYDPRVMMAESIIRRPVAQPGLDPVQPEQGLTALEAFEGYTNHAAKAIGATDEGQIVAGAQANFTVFTADPLHLSAEELAEVRVLATFVQGQRSAAAVAVTN
ncbi:MAG: amidohydrolase [Micrococcaceae bacterium]|nr:amidohydrolase [Micrococcaceae bacterium]